jgi:hypothetical protein
VSPCSRDITSIDSSAITGVINGIIAIVAFGAALWSWYKHRQNNAIQQ